MGDENQMGDIRAGDVATTLYKVALSVQDNGLLLSEILRRVRRLEGGAVIRHHVIVANALTTLAIAAVMYRSYRKNLRGALARRKNDST